MVSSLKEHKSNNPSHELSRELWHVMTWSANPELPLRPVPQLRGAGQALRLLTGLGDPAVLMRVKSHFCSKVSSKVNTSSCDYWVSEKFSLSHMGKSFWSYYFFFPKYLFSPHNRIPSGRQASHQLHRRWWSKVKLDIEVYDCLGEAYSEKKNKGIRRKYCFLTSPFNCPLSGVSSLMVLTGKSI